MTTVATPSSPTRIPIAPLLLGAAGALPFIAGAISCLFTHAEFALMSCHALVDYGAVILSFMGAIHWGAAMAQRRTDFVCLGVSVMPALVAWAAALIGAHVGATILAISFAVLLAYDLAATARGEVPPWYPKLRWPLTIAAAGSLAIGAAT